MTGSFIRASTTNAAAGQIELSGNGYLAGEGDGIVTVAGAPAKRRVIVYDWKTERIVGSVVSSDDGTWRVEGLNPRRKFKVIAVDHTNQFNAVIRDNITPFVDP